MNFIKKNWFLNLLTLFVFVSISFPVTSFAQQVDSSKDSQIGIKINNTAYSSEERLVTISYDVVNNSNSFIDDLSYVFEFYNGPKLADRGYLFKDLKYVVATVGDFEKLAPKQKVRKTIEYKIPESIPGGPYFIRGAVYNEAISIYGVDYTKEPLNLTGRGGFISNKLAVLVDLSTGTTYKAMVGSVLERENDHVVRFSKDKNKELFNALDKNEIFSNIRITKVNDEKEIVYESEKIALSTLVVEDGSSIDFKVPKNDKINTGSYTMMINFKDANGNQVTEDSFSRLLYKGIFGRIYKVDTNINSYRKGESVFIYANTVIAGDETAKKAYLSASVKFEGKIVQEFKKTIDLDSKPTGTDVMVDFRDLKMKSTTLIDEVSLTLTTEDGTILDEQSIEIDLQKIFSYPKKTNMVKNILIGLGILIALVGLLALIRKKKINQTFASIIIAVVMITSAVFLGDTSPVSAQCFDEFGNSNDCGSVNCDDVTASNFGQNGECVYGEVDPQCTDPTALNFGENGVCRYSEDPYQPGGGCTDFSATNWDSSAIYDDGTCNYDQTGCTYPSASNYDPNAQVDDGSCEACTDPNANNYVPGFTHDDGSCTYEANIKPPGDLIQIEFIGSVPSDEICKDPVPDDFYVKLQCKVCGNAALDLEVNYYNKGIGQTSAYDYSFTLFTEQVGNGHVFNNFVFGPFDLGFVLENKNPDGSLNKSLYVDGEYTQKFAVKVKAPFGSNFCQIDDPYGGVYEGFATEIEEDISLCPLPAEVRASFYIDYNEDGNKNPDEPFIKSKNASGSCYGEIGPLLGLVQNENGATFSGLVPSSCSEENKPYFFKDLLDDGRYKSLLDPNGSFGFIQTGVKYLIDSNWVDVDYVELVEKDILQSLIGVKLNEEVSLSCGATPAKTAKFPVSVVWSTTMWSDTYDVEDLEFVWDATNASLPDNAVRYGSQNEGNYAIDYSQNTGGAKNYAVSVYARNSAGETVSNTANCAIDIDPMRVSCAAYPSLAAVNSGGVQTFFDPGQPVFWSAETHNLGSPIYYRWFGTGLRGNQGNNNKTVGPVYYSDYGQKIVEIEAEGVENRSVFGSCPIFIRQCRLDEECQNGYVCNASTFTCLLPPPVFITPLTLDRSLINTGNYCRLKWTVSDADSCVLYKNNIPINTEAPVTTEGTEGESVDPGTYTILCENENGLSVTGGPVRCLVNPNIKEE